MSQIKQRIKDIINESFEMQPLIVQTLNSDDAWRHELDGIYSKWQYNDKFEQIAFNLRKKVIGMVYKYGANKVLKHIQSYRDTHFSKDSKEYDILTDMMKAFILNKPNQIEEQENIFYDKNFVNDDDEIEEYYYKNKYDIIKKALDLATTSKGLIVKYGDHLGEKDTELKNLADFLKKRNLIYYTNENNNIINYYITGNGKIFLDKLKKQL